MEKLTVEQCKRYSKEIKNWFGKSDHGTVMLYHADGHTDICDYSDYERIRYESDEFKILFIISCDEATKWTATQISYEIYAMEHRSVEEEEKFLSGYIEATRGVYTISEAAKKWNKDTSTIRKAIAAKRMKENIDYRKAGKVYLIKHEAMERLYGKLNNK